MIRRVRIFHVVLAAALLANTWAGVSRIRSFVLRFDGEEAIARGELDQAYERLLRARWWQPGDSPGHVLIGKVVQHAKSNGLTLASLGGLDQQQTLGVGAGAVARGIVLNPADAWTWLNLATLYQGHRTARVRVEILRRLGAPATETRTSALDPEDVVSLAAIHKAIEAEPDFYFHHDFLAKLYWDRGMKQEAAEAITSAMALMPRLPEHPILALEPFIREMAEPILSGIRMGGRNPYLGPVMAARARAGILEKLNRHADAVEAYAELRELGGEQLWPECDLSIGKLEQLQGRWNESIPSLEQALSNGEGTPVGAAALYYLGLAQERLQQHASAEDYFRRYLARTPGALHGYLRLADTLEAQGRSAMAEEVLLGAVRKFPEDRQAYDKLIAHMRVHGRSRQAIPYAEALKKLDPDQQAVDRLLDLLRKEGARQL